MTLVVWVPGRFRLTNQLLDDLRSAGKYEGFAKAKGWVVRANHDNYADHQAAVRLAVAAQARRLGIACHVVVNLTFLVFGHHRHDPDAWYLLAKAATDGLIDAHVLSSDRFGVWSTVGRVLRTIGEESAVCHRLRGEAGAVVPVALGPGAVGLAIVVEDAPEWCGHV